MKSYRVRSLRILSFYFIISLLFLPISGCSGQASNVTTDNITDIRSPSATDTQTQSPTDTATDTPIAEVTDTPFETQAETNTPNATTLPEATQSPSPSNTTNPTQSPALTPIPTTSTTPAIQPPDNTILGLYIVNGVLYKSGKPYIGAGINYYDGFPILLEGESDGYEENFTLMKKYNIPYARMSFSPYWPVEFKQYAENKELFFDKMDAVVREAEKQGVGIIASLFWYYAGITDFCDEPVNAWGDPDSKTRKLMREYTKEVVTKYKDSPAIWGWEFGNEYNLCVDLPNAKDGRPPIVPSLGTRLTRDENDDLKTDQISPAMQEFAKIVRSIDKHRIITSGNAAPRPSQNNMKVYRNWTLDTRAEMVETLMWHNPDPMDCISIHVYEEDNRDYGGDFETVIKIMSEESKNLGKVLFIGEYGGDESMFGHEKLKENFTRVLKAIEENQVPISAVWNLRHPKYDTNTIKEENERAYMLTALQEFNIKWYAAMGQKFEN